MCDTTAPGTYVNMWHSGTGTVKKIILPKHPAAFHTILSMLTSGDSTKGRRKRPAREPPKPPTGITKQP